MKFRSAGGPSPQSEALPPLPCPTAPLTPRPCPAQPSPCVGPRWSPGRSGIPVVTWAPSLLGTRVCGPCVLTKRERPVRRWKGSGGVGALPAPWTQECSPANMGRGCHGPSVGGIMPRPPADAESVPVLSLPPPPHALSSWPPRPARVCPFLPHPAPTQLILSPGALSGDALAQSPPPPSDTLGTSHPATCP